MQGHAKAIPFEPSARIEDRMVFRRGRDYMVAVRRQDMPATPLRARLLLSVAPLVKTISLGLAPIRLATCSRACSSNTLNGAPAVGGGLRRKKSPQLCPPMCQST